MTATPTATPTPTPTPKGKVFLTALSPAKLWIGSNTGSDPGIRFDLVAKVLLNLIPVGFGQLSSVPGGTKQFEDATLDVMPLTLAAPIAVSPGDVLALHVLVRNACSGSEQQSGKARLWYDGRPIDSGPTSDAGSRFDATIGGTSHDYFLRREFLLSTTPGSSRTSIETQAGKRCGPFHTIGTWRMELP